MAVVCSMIALLCACPFLFPDTFNHVGFLPIAYGSVLFWIAACGLVFIIESVVTGRRPFSPSRSEIEDIQPVFRDMVRR